MQKFLILIPQNLKQNQELDFFLFSTEEGFV